AVIGKECFKEHSAIVTRVIRKAIENIVNSLNNFQQIHILDIIDLQKTNGGKYINLPMNIVAENAYGDIILRLKNDDTIDYSPLKIALKNFEEKQLQKGIFMGKIFNYNIFIRLIMKNKSINIKGNDYTRYFEFPVDSDIVIRQREQGDKFVPYGMKGNKKLKDLFMDMKISKEKRDKTPIVLFDNVITWIVGYRTSNNFKIDKDTKQILEIKAEWEDTTYDE
ncbi:tRNA lysidine(34) synthetase TilS, partial [Clostridium cadaveris]